MKGIYLFVLGSLLTGYSFAQTTTTDGSGTATQTRTSTSSRVSFGLKGGLNVANVEVSEYAVRESRKSFHAGALAHIHINPNFAVQPEVVYSRQGLNANNDIVKWELDYVNIPVLLQYMNHGVRVQTGPQLGFLVSAEEFVEGRKTADFKGHIDGLDFAWTFGLGYLSPIGIGVDARYNLGINNINETVRFAERTPEIKNRVWQFGLFYQFNR